MDEIEIYKRFCICCCKPLKDKYRLMKTGRLTIVGEAFVTATQLSIAGKQVFRVKKLVGRRWGAPNSKDLLVMVSTFVMPFSMDLLSRRMTPGCIM